MTVLSTRQRWEVGLSRLFAHNTAMNARYLAHPCDANGVPLPEQPTAEQSAHAELVADGCDEMAAFYQGIADADDAARAAEGLPAVEELPTVADAVPPE